MTEPEMRYEKTRLLTRNNRVRIILDASRYAILNESATDEFGQSLPEYAASDPNGAYNFLRRAIGSSAAEHCFSVEKDNETLASMVFDGTETTHSTAEDAVYDILPTSYDRSFRVHIETPFAWETSGSESKETMQLLEFNVTPENLST